MRLLYLALYNPPQFSNWFVYSLDCLHSNVCYIEGPFRSSHPHYSIHCSMWKLLTSLLKVPLSRRHLSESVLPPHPITLPPSPPLNWKSDPSNTLNPVTLADRPSIHNCQKKTQQTNTTTLILPLLHQALQSLSRGHQVSPLLRKKSLNLKSLTMLR